MVWMWSRTSLASRRRISLRLIRISTAPVVAADHLAEHVEPPGHTARHRHTLTSLLHRPNGTRTKIVEAGHKKEATPRSHVEGDRVP